MLTRSPGDSLAHQSSDRDRARMLGLTTIARLVPAVGCPTCPSVNTPGACHVPGLPEERCRP
eukprot:6250014-Prymnesium_polylepis.1